MTARRARTFAGVITFLFLATLVSGPVRADTATELNAARQRLAAIDSALNRLAAQYDAARTRYALTQTRIDSVQSRIDAVRARVADIQRMLGARAREAYETGGAGSTLEILLTSDSFTQFSDRIEFLGAAARQDSDLLTQAAVAREDLRRSEADLAALAKQQGETIQSLVGTRTSLDQTFAQQQAQVRDLQNRFAAEQAAAATAAAAAAAAAARARAGSGGGHAGALKACPVGQPRAFGDDFGAPRPGGRTHQGIDILAPLGTPVYAAQPGRFEQNYNDLGGTSALVYADNGDMTYYAHMSAYAGVPNGAHVAAGTMIGHVGNTGDAQGGPYHLHFEYHPGGGAAVDPYRLLVAVCG